MSVEWTVSEKRVGESYVNHTSRVSEGSYVTHVKRMSNREGGP